MLNNLNVVCVSSASGYNPLEKVDVYKENNFTSLTPSVLPSLAMAYNSVQFSKLFSVLVWAL
jgi:hypothetical protein